MKKAILILIVVMSVESILKRMNFTKDNNDPGHIAIREHTHDGSFTVTILEVEAVQFGKLTIFAETLVFLENDIYHSETIYNEPELFKPLEGPDNKTLEIGDFPHHFKYTLCNNVDRIKKAFPDSIVLFDAWDNRSRV